MEFLGEADTKQQMNAHGESKTGFFFIISYDKSQNVVVSLDNIDQTGIRFAFPGYHNSSAKELHNSIEIRDKQLPTSDQFRKAFEKVLFHLQRGDSYLCNLTFQVPIHLTGTLLEAYQQANALFKVYLPELFTSFSPERFIQIENNQLHTFPMKGTIEDSGPDSLKSLLDDPKELSEHYTVVDLLRNDISQIGTNTRVETIRSASQIQTSKGSVYQTSSHIITDLKPNWKDQIGELLFKLLPAGSITGAPKMKTIEIISQAENYDRKWYTGIAGYFDGKKLDSCVLIRYIGQDKGKHFYYTGGGLTTRSEWEKEYEEIRTKIYIPIF